MIIEVASNKDFAYLSERDPHISKMMLEQKLKLGEILIANDSETIGFLRFNYFWDNTPFMNLLFVEANYRLKGIGKQLVLYWENLMRNYGYSKVMTSTLANEEAQFFYRKLGYKDAGSLLVEGEALEIIFIKDLSN